MTLEERVQTLENKVEELQKGQTKGKFKKPDSSEIFAYMRQKLVGTDGFIQTQTEMFLDHYESNGWKVGRVPMKDWKAAIRNWVLNIKNKTFDANNQRAFGSKPIPTGSVRKGGFGQL